MCSFASVSILLVKILRRVVRRLARQRRVPEHPALLHRHDVEGGADHAVVGAQRVGLGDRKALLGERGDDAELAIDRMRRRQQFAERLAPHHIGTAGRIEPVGRIGLAALELQDGQRSLITLDVLAHPAVEAHLIDPMPLLDRLGAGKLLVFPDAVGHGDAPSVSSLGSVLKEPPLHVGCMIFSENRVSTSPDQALNGSKRLHTSEVQVWQWRGYAPRPDRRRAAWCASRHSPAQGPHRRRRRRRRRPGSPGR